MRPRSRSRCHLPKRKADCPGSPDKESWGCIPKDDRDLRLRRNGRTRRSSQPRSPHRRLPPKDIDCRSRSLPSLPKRRPGRSWPECTPPRRTSYYWEDKPSRLGRLQRNTGAYRHSPRMKARCSSRRGRFRWQGSESRTRRSCWRLKPSRPTGKPQPHRSRCLRPQARTGDRSQRRGSLAEHNFRLARLRQGRREPAHPSCPSRRRSWTKSRSSRRFPRTLPKLPRCCRCPGSRRMDCLHPSSFRRPTGRPSCCSTMTTRRRRPRCRSMSTRCARRSRRGGHRGESGAFCPRPSVCPMRSPGHERTQQRRHAYHPEFTAGSTRTCQSKCRKRPRSTRSCVAPPALTGRSDSPLRRRWACWGPARTDRAGSRRCRRGSAVRAGSRPQPPPRWASGPRSPNLSCNALPRPRRRSGWTFRRRRARAGRA